MSKQVEALIKGKQETEGTLHSLKRQVDALDELVSSSSTDSLFPSLNSPGFTDSLRQEPSLAKNQVRLPDNVVFLASIGTKPPLQQRYPLSVLPC